MLGYKFKYGFNSGGEYIAPPLPDWTTVTFSDGNDLVFSDNNNLGYGA